MDPRNEPIAVIGSGCRFPGGAASPSKLWELLHSPRDVLCDFPEERLNLGAFSHRDGEHHGSTDVCNKSYLIQEDTRHFDASFFNINPAEAEGMDPQQRIALEVAYEAMESAGYTLKQMQGSLTSVHLGVMTADYMHIQTRDPETINRYHAVGTANSILSNRVSYVFDLRGPSMTLDTACSSSLAAVHLAVQSLRRGESKLALAMGANLILDPTGYISESKLHMLSPRSRSAMWDASADGYARGEGVAAVMLKPLSDAIRDQDHIECIVRETGMNSDGRTPGITMPSSEAQATLIRRTYAAAGLDTIQDRPQYFECHGTGTLAGDPAEARAIHSAFFTPGTEVADQRDRLYCGSIKTVIGHTEGCAGIAGLLKVSLALQAETIPPNLLFNRLNPAIKPLYNNLQLPLTSTPWPEGADGCRRASLNSFGFGGSNVHAIIEQYTARSSTCDTPGPGTMVNGESSPFIGPLLFSAESQTSLVRNMAQLVNYIAEHPAIDLNDLSWVMQNRRNAFNFRASFVGATRDDLVETLRSTVDQHKQNPSGTKVLKSLAPSEQPALLGIFTGQGAQWAAMGKELYSRSNAYRASIDRCADALRNIQDAPSWSLVEELLAFGRISRIGEAQISQPLCTAVQIALVDVLHLANVRFAAVVGHSSGEIAAAYAAGILSAVDAMRIAYYRGFFAKLARGKDGKQGAMMAVGLGFEDAVAFCKQFEGRITLAATNAPTSSTISGDADAIAEAKILLDESKTFARVLMVDTAYHSHHMLPCGDAYLEALASCDIQVNAPNENCVWISSVYGNAEILDYHEDMEALKGQYWVDNMLKPVLFSETVECALWRAGPFDVAIEVGPHPALKGPTSQTIKAALGHTLPYATVMKRGNDNVQDFSAGLGFLWTHLDGMVDFAGYHKAMVGSESPTPAMLKGLPSYAWDHDRVYWKESRPSRRYRLARQAPHELLGRLTGDSVDSDMRWRNVIRLSELPWLRGHAFQGQALFPTSAYLAMAFQAAKEIAGDRIITTIEVTDFSIPRGLALQDGNSGYESIFSVSQENIGASADVFRGRFVCTTSSNDPSGTMELRCSGSLSIEFGEGSPEILPSSAYTLPNLTAIEPDEYYDSLLAIGLDYQGPFRGIKSISRALGYGVAKATWKASDVGSGSDYMIHPGPLDVAFHTIMAGVSSPLSEALYAPFLPVGIKKLILNPSVSYRYHDDRTGHSDGDEMGLDIVTCITNKDQTSFEGEVTILGTDERPMLQMEGFLLKRVRDSKPSDDRTLFSKTIWQRDILSSDNNLVPIVPIDPALIVAINRTSLYYLNQVFANLSEDDVKKPFHLNFLSASKHYLSMIQRGGMPGIDPKWLHDSKETIDIYKTQYSGQADLELIHVVGKNLLDVITGDLQLLELMLQDDRWTNLYLEGRAFEPLNNAIGDLVANISHRYPRMKILEIGAGTGGTTSFVLDRVGNAYGTYTFTDVSAGFFSNAKSKFGTHAAQLKFEVLDIEKDPLQQGFQEGSYDIIVAAAVLHATRDIRQTLTHARTLLKPGGWLIMSEHTCDSLDMLLIMGGLPGWWLGMDDGRTLSPGIKLEAWEQCLLETGFSGVDKHVSDVPDPLCHSFSVIVSQAIDDRITRIRDPLSYIDEMPLEEHLLIIGGMSLSTSRMAKAIERLALRFSDKVTLVKSLDEVPENQQERSMSVVCLADLEYSTVSETISSTRLSKLQWIFSNATNVLWLTSGRESEKPFANLFVGMARAIANELPQLKIQWLDVDAADSSLDARLIMDMFLKLKLANSPEFREGPLLYSIEPEIIIRDNYLVIPRQRVDQARNDRLNSDRRTISSQVSLRATTLQLVYSGATLSLEDLTPWRTPGLTKNNGSPSIFVDHSISIPYSGLQQYFLSLGRVVDGTESFMSISDRNCSRMYREQAFQPCDLDTAPKTDVLRAVSGSVGALFLKTFIERFAPPGGTLIHGCLPDVARALLSIAPNLKIYFGWEKDTIEGPQHFRIHRRATTHALRRSLPADIRSVLFLSDETNNSVQDQLSSIYTTLDLSAASSPMLSNKEIRRWIETSLARTSLPALLGPVVRVQDITALSLGQVLFPTVVDWTDHEALARTSIRSLRGSSLLSGDKTYLMVGLTSELGISICKWMVENGARHIILTSRSAQVNDSALAEMRALGAMIYVRKMDVTDMKSVQGLRDDISAQLPPVGGICNGALILRDALFVEMQADHINDVLAPKVAGTIHLSEVFKESPLDFFISFSSISSVQGNPGQCGYNAASLFQTAFTNQRRSRGLPASVITLGIIPELGYIAKRGRAFLEKLKPEFYLMMSETDVHQAFAESIAASAIDAPDEDAEVVAGIRLFNYNSKTERQPFWFSNPRLSHFVREEADISSEVGGNDSDATKVAILVDAAENEEEAQALITLAFASKLEAMLQMLPGSLNTEISLLDTGIDSLLAVEIRGWFLKELQVDVPVLKSLGGESAVAICADVTKQYLSAKIRARASEQDAARSGQSPQASEKANTAESSRAGTNSSSASQNGSTGESIVTGITTPPISEDGASETPQVKVSSDVGRTEALSFAQSRLWFLTQLYNDQTFHNTYALYTIKGFVQIPRLRRAVAAIVNHHDSLRSCFFVQATTGLPVQALLKKPTDCFRQVPNALQEDVDAEIEELKHRPWDIANGNGVQISLFSFSAEVHQLVIGYHHIVMDGVSMHILLRELHAIYSGKEPTSTPLQYLDIAKAEHENFTTGHMDKKISYWCAELSPPPEPLPLLRFSQTKTRRPAVNISNHEARKEMSQEFTNQVKLAGRKMNVTPFYVHTATIQLFLHRLLGISDVCIGALDADRSENNQGVIGLFLNMLPVRVQAEGTESFSHLVAKTSQKYRSGVENAGVPFDAMIKDAGVGRDATCTPLFQVAINYRQGQFFNMPLGNARMDCVTTSEAKSPFDIVFCVTPAVDTCWVQVITRGDIYDSAAAHEILKIYLRLLGEVVQNTSISLQRVQPYDPASIGLALQIGQAKSEDFQWPATLSEKIDEVSAQYHDQVALTGDYQTLTYRQMQRKRDILQLAIELRSLAPGKIVAVLLQPGVDWPVSMLAILRAGATYVPLDSSLPDERLHQILLISNATLLIHNGDSTERAQILTNKVTNLDLINIDQLKADVLVNSSNKEIPGAQCFILFTSGSTGVPKGIKLSQKGFINYLASKGKLLGLQREVVMQQSALGFDMSLAQALQSLCRGGTLVVAPQHARGDPVALSELILRHAVTFTVATPTEYLTLLHYGTPGLKFGTAWKYACSGGEAVTSDLKRSLQSMQRAPILADCYGPTEISCCATMNVISLDDLTELSVTSVGRANPNTSIYILDESGSVLPIGHRGEIAIGGVGLALGYLDEYNTARAFVPYPSLNTDRPVLYKTGDSGMLKEDGSVVFQGRMDGDTTIKIRGLRVDLQEIEKSMSKTFKNLIKDVVVSARGEPAVLVAHVVLASTTDEHGSSLLDLVSALPLPQYMKPSIVRFISQLPVSSNGKLDRKAISLLPLTTKDMPGHSTRPLTLVEGELKLIWARALSQKNSSPGLGPDTDFFQIGGTSLALIKLRAYMHSSMGVDVSLHDLYNSSTLQSMALLALDRKSKYQPVVIDWHSETEVPADFRPATTQSTDPRNENYGLEILLTGSANFLGGTILKALLQQPSVRHIHCLAVDQDDLRHHVQDSRISIHRGSLEEPRLGLDEATFDRIFGTVHRIVHAGARGHCLNNFTTVRTANLGATQTIALAGAQRQIPIHYVSSNRVTLLDPQAGAALPPVSVAAHQPDTSGSEGFTASKWAGEVFLEKLGCRAHELTRPVPITIHRPCAVTGSEAPAEDALNAVLRMSKTLHAVPALAEMNVHGYLDFIDVHVVAEGIASAVVSDATVANAITTCAPTIFRHYSSGEKVPPAELRSYLETTNGEKFEELPFYTWLEAAREAGMEDIISSYLEAIVEKKGMLRYPYMGQEE